MKKRCFILTILPGVLAGAGSMLLLLQKINKNMQKENDQRILKFKSYYSMLNQWLGVKQNNGNLATYFNENGYKNIAIYGMGEMGNRLYDELKDTSVNVAYGIDKNPGECYSDLEIFEISGNLPDVDAIIVTAVFAYEDIKKDIEAIVKCPIISLEDIVYECR